MRKAYNETNDAVLEIQPIAGARPQKINYKQEEVFDKKVPAKEEKEEEKEEVKEEEKEEVSLNIKEKRGIGQRGKDKKPRVKRENVSERQLAHLAKCREISKQKREARRNVEKERKEPVKTKEIKEEQTMEYDKFFSLMEKYDTYKEKKKEINKVETKQQPLPSNVKSIHRPKKPVLPPVSSNPYDVFFSY